MSRGIEYDKLQDATAVASMEQDLKNIGVAMGDAGGWTLTDAERQRIYRQLPVLQRVPDTPLLTASQLPALLGAAHWGERSSVIRDSVRRALGVPSDFDGNRATEHGILHEPYALAVYNQLMDTTHTTNIERYTHGEHVWLGATPDFVELLNGVPISIGEIKCPYLGVSDVQAYLLRYHHQVQCQLYVTGADLCDFILYNASSGSVLPTVIHGDPYWWDDNGSVIEDAAKEIRDVLVRLCSQEYLATAGGRALLVQYVY